jgi:hypothetical protein
MQTRRHSVCAAAPAGHALRPPRGGRQATRSRPGGAGAARQPARGRGGAARRAAPLSACAAAGSRPWCGRPWHAAWGGQVRTAGQLGTARTTSRCTGDWSGQPASGAHPCIHLGDDWQVRLRKRVQPARRQRRLAVHDRRLQPGQVHRAHLAQVGYQLRAPARGSATRAQPLRASRLGSVTLDAAAASRGRWLS